jgi:hypothetical protein
MYLRRSTEIVPILFAFDEGLSNDLAYVIGGVAELIYWMLCINEYGSFFDVPLSFVSTSVHILHLGDTPCSNLHNCQRYLSLTIDMMNEIQVLEGFLGAQTGTRSIPLILHSNDSRTVERSCVGEMEREVHDIFSSKWRGQVRYLLLPPLFVKY